MSDVKYLFIVLVIAILGPFASDSYLPSLPMMASYFYTTENMMQFSISIYFLGYSIPQLFWGPLSDRFGRRHALQWGCVVAIIGCIICIFAFSAEMLILGRFIQGSGVAASGALYRAILRDRFSGRRLAQAGSFVGLFFALIPAIAPILGGFIEAIFFWQANFVFLFILTLGTLVFINKVFPETNLNLNKQALEKKVLLKNYKILLSHKPFLGYVATSSAAFSGIIAYYTVSPFLFQSILGLTPFQYGLTAIGLTIGMVCGQLLNSLFVTKVGIHLILQTSFLVMFLSGALLLTLELMGILTVASVLIPTIFFIMGSGLTFANAAAGAFQPFSHIVGVTGALFGCLQVFGTTVVSFIVALQPDTSGMVLAITYIVLSLIAWLSYGFLVKSKA